MNQNSLFLVLITQTCFTVLAGKQMYYIVLISTVILYIGKYSPHLIFAPSILLVKKQILNWVNSIHDS